MKQKPLTRLIIGVVGSVRATNALPTDMLPADERCMSGDIL